MFGMSSMPLMSSLFLMHCLIVFHVYHVVTGMRVLWSRMGVLLYCFHRTDPLSVIPTRPGFGGAGH